jgi:hypothetical protein
MPLSIAFGSQFHVEFLEVLGELGSIHAQLLLVGGPPRHLGLQLVLLVEELGGLLLDRLLQTPELDERPRVLLSRDPQQLDPVG